MTSPADQLAAIDEALTEGPWGVEDYGETETGDLWETYVHDPDRNGVFHAASGWDHREDLAGAITLRNALPELVEVVSCAEELRILLSDRDYTPDSFTGQPLDAALSRLTAKLGGGDE